MDSSVPINPLAGLFCNLLRVQIGRSTGLPAPTNLLPPPGERQV